MSYEFNSIDEALEDIKKGKLVIVLDSEEREYEGDFIGAAATVTPEMVNIMVTHGRGAFIAVFMPAGLCDKLEIPPMWQGKNDSFNETKFRLAVDAKSGGSGSSAHDRALTAQLLGKADTKPEDFVRPGHVVPIEAHPGGILARDGHTESGVELMKLAGIDPPVAIDLEILEDDGSMAHEEKLFELAKKFDLKVINVKDLIEYVKNKQNVEV